MEGIHLGRSTALPLPHLFARGYRPMGELGMGINNKPAMTEAVRFDVICRPVDVRIIRGV